MSQTQSANTSHANTTFVVQRARMTPPALNFEPGHKPFPELEIFLSNSSLSENLTHIMLKDIS